MRGRRLLWITLMAVLAGLAAVRAEGKEKWGPFRGQIVDVETGQPIAGAVALVIWYKLVPALVQTNTEFYDALEAVTDAEGRFEVPRLKPPFFGFQIFNPGVGYFAPGYVPDSEIVTPPDGQPFVAPTVVRMRRLKTLKELREKSRGYSTIVPPHKMAQFLRAINAEYEMLGMKPIVIEPDEGKRP